MLLFLAVLVLRPPAARGRQQIPRHQPAHGRRRHRCQRPLPDQRLDVRVLLDHLHASREQFLVIACTAIFCSCSKESSAMSHLHDRGRTSSSAAARMSAYFSRREAIAFFSNVLSPIQGADAPAGSALKTDDGCPKPEVVEHWPKQSGNPKQYSPVPNNSTAASIANLPMPSIA
ncbi:MAG: hypothetical protein QM747_09730 [Nocardioides sp.]